MTPTADRIACIGLGSNLDEPESQVRAGIEDLARLPHTRVVRTSRLFRSAPWGGVRQPDFVNAAVEVATRLDPRALLDALLAVERAHGRVRDGTRWGPRVLDLDLLLYGDLVVDEAGLRIPHPHLAERAFVLLPLADINPGLEIPGQGRVRDLLARIDASGCVPID